MVLKIQRLSTCLCPADLEIGDTADKEVCGTVAARAGCGPGFMAIMAHRIRPCLVIQAGGGHGGGGFADTGREFGIFGGLGQLHDEIKRRFLTLDREERTVRDMVAKMESGFAGRLAEFQHGR